MRLRANIAAAALSLLAVGAGCAATPATTPSASQPPTAVIAPVTPPAGTPPTAAPTPAPAAARKVTVQLKAVGDWKQSGTATLTDLPGNETRIDISLAGPNPDVAQPAAIYSGNCTVAQAEVQYALAPVVNGKSSTVLDVNLTAIIDKAAQALKVKRDPVDGKLPYAVCGELK
jgi:hypothetical protein